MISRCGRNYGGYVSKHFTFVKKVTITLRKRFILIKIFIRKVAIKLRFILKVKLFKIHPFKSWIHFVRKKNTKIIAPN